jgi:superfamily II DNA helicase RecQ
MSIGLYDGGSSTILILPLVSMHEEYKSRAQKYGLSCKTWSSHCDLATSPQLLLVAVENCTWPSLQAHIMTLVRLGRLSRIVVDEAHLLLKHEFFRPCMGMLSFLGMLPISIILMTATCPPGLEQELFEKIGRAVYQVVRRSTDRPEIAQKFVSLRVDSGDLERIVSEEISSIARCMKGTERALLFCNSRDECDRMASLLGWMPYHSSIAGDDRSESMKLWKNGTTLGLVSTSMLNCCLDYHNVPYIFHLGPPRDAVDYYQAIGRSARAGGVGTSIVYFNPLSLRKPKSGGIDRFGELVIYDMMHDTSLCRRLRPSFFLDGVGVPCAMLAGAELCDICAAQSNVARPNPGLRRIPGYLVTKS